MNRILVLLGTAALACGGASGNVDAAVSGSVNGISLSSLGDSEALILLETSCEGPPNESNLQIVIGSRGGLCNSVTGGKVPSNLTYLGFNIYSFWEGGGSLPAQAPPLGALTYTIGNTAPDANGFFVSVSASLNQSDSSCQIIQSSRADAISGTITLTSLSSTGVTGSFNLSFNGGSLTGTFAPITCILTQAQQCASSFPSTCGS